MLRAGHGIRPTRAPLLSCYDDIDRIIPSHRVPVETEPAAAATRTVRAGQHLAAIHHFDVVRTDIEVVVDPHKTRLIAQKVLVPGDALAAGIARPVARQRAGR